MKLTVIIMFLLNVLMTSTSLADQSSHERAALELLKVTNSMAMLEQTRDLMRKVVQQSLAAVDVPPEGAEFRDALQKDLMDGITEMLGWHELRDQMVTVYVEVFTEDELKQLVAFYETPLGRKLLEKTPQLIQRSMELSQEILQRHMPAFQKRLEKTISELKARYGKD